MARELFECFWNYVSFRLMSSYCVSVCVWSVLFYVHYESVHDKIEFFFCFLIDISELCSLCKMIIGQWVS